MTRSTRSKPRIWAQILRIFREPLANGANDQKRATAILTLVRELGLRPAPAPAPLPVVDLDDIHLVCWIAPVPSGDSP